MSDIGLTELVGRRFVLSCNFFPKSLLEYEITGEQDYQEVV